MNVELSESNWFKSSHSSGATECVEVAWLPAGHVGVRDSKNPAGPALVFAPGAWASFTAAVIGGEFDQR